MDILTGAALEAGRSLLGPGSEGPEQLAGQCGRGNGSSGTRRHRAPVSLKTGEHCGQDSRQHTGVWLIDVLECFQGVT